MSTLTYPKSPVSLPKKLTALTPSYQFKASLAVLSIILFFILYAALVVGLGYLAYYAFIYEMFDVNKLTILMKIGAIAGSAMLFVFTLKFIFKLKNVKQTNRIKLIKSEQPELWNFILKICEETGAPKPKNIWIDPDVNAYVSYTNMWLSLFLPVRKELTIGLGLVDTLNMSEFKAVMSHEFGHFAQSSMKIGSYIISANTIIHDMIFSRDKWDELLDQWRGADLRLSAAAWLITPVIWIIRQVLNLFYQFLNIMYSSLSREMEFNADKVAVSTSGSDAIVSALWKLDHGFTAWNQTIQQAYLASQKRMYVSNLYHHNGLVHDRNLPKQKEALEALPSHDQGGKLFFSSSDHSKVGMYASHPPNDKRQESAKVPFIDCPIDESSPWDLFADKEKIQKQMTSLVYEQYLNKVNTETVQPEAFEEFIKTENQGKELLDEYLGTFENRFFWIPTMDELEKDAQKQTVNKDSLSKIKSDLALLMAPVKEIESLMEQAAQIAQGTTKLSSFSFNGETYKKRNLQEGYAKLVTERENLFNESFKEWDKTLCAFHLKLATDQNQGKALKDLYFQHQHISALYRQAANTKNSIYNKLQELQSREVEQNEVRSFGYAVNNQMTDLNKRFNDFDTINFVPLPNIHNLQELKEAIVENGEFVEEKGNMFESGGFERQMTRLENTINHCQRIEQKNIGVILKFHHELQEILAN